MGDISLLPKSDESDFARAPEHSLYVRSFPLLQKPALFRRKRVYLFGAALYLGSTTALVLTAAHLPLIDLFIRREEKQLEQKFGNEWVAYKKQVRRWL